MRLEGSCHCGAVRFRVETQTPYPFNLCYCSICRKTAGGGGYAINIMGLAQTLEVTGEENLATYQAVLDRETSPCERKFCGTCGSHLWLADPRWPDWLYPLASAIDSPLPVPPERVHLMIGSRAHWVEVRAGPNDAKFEGYPEESIEDWHKARSLSETE